MLENELGRFLRSHREAIAPEQVGLGSGTRRRTPGLRRSELATLAGISVEYLTRLEQGRDTNPSAAVRHALIAALQLSPGEAHLLHRAAETAGERHCPVGQPPARIVRSSIRLLLEQFEATPAAVLNRAGDILAWNTVFERLAAQSGLLDAEIPNIPRFIFTDARARDLYPDWGTVADLWAAELREGASHLDHHVARLVDELADEAGAAFRDLWSKPPTIPSRHGRERLMHPDHGELILDYEVLELPDCDDQRLLVQLPADERTSALLTELTTDAPPALRVVGG